MDVSGKKKGKLIANTILDTTLIFILNHVQTQLPNQVEELETIQQVIDRNRIRWDILLNKQRGKIVQN